MSIWIIALLGFLGGWALSMTVFLLVANFRKNSPDPTKEKLLGYWERAEITAVERNIQLERIVTELQNISMNQVPK